MHKFYEILALKAIKLITLTCNNIYTQALDWLWRREAHNFYYDPLIPLPKQQEDPILQ